MKKVLKKLAPVGLGLSTAVIVAIATPYVVNREYRKSVYVFGTPSPQPPELHVSDRIQIRLGLTSEQVCGYTDWTKAALTVPSQLLDKTFWNDKIKRFKTQAEEVAKNLTGAIPSMLACNISPTFCNVLNHAEILAQWEFAYTVDQCKILQLAEDATVVNEHLKSCIKKQINEKGKTANYAREYCLTSNKDNSERSIFDIDKLWTSICPNQTTYNTYTSVRRGGGGHTYKRVEKSCSWAKEIFRGFSVTNAGRLTHGSTFGITIDSKLKEISKKTETQINGVVSVLLEKYRQGKDPNSILNSADVTRHFQENNNEPPYFMRASLDGTQPIPLITVGHMYQLMQLVIRDNVDEEYNDSLSAYAQALSRVAQAASYVHTIDQLSALLTKSIEKCGSDPELKSAVAQKNCNSFNHQLETQLKILAERRQSEESYYRTQDQVSEFVQAELLRRRDVVEPKYAPLPKAYSNAIPVPSPRSL